eukprot:GEMP01116481.1.p1 GENE.GEMP01116481.1~~GEMP01116481.1.p1  ORF type:complete len:134 (-),score=19.48 GEMP01116481.1:6-407(-)
MATLVQDCNRSLRDSMASVSSAFSYRRAVIDTLWFAKREELDPASKVVLDEWLTPPWSVFFASAGAYYGTHAALRRMSFFRNRPAIPQLFAVIPAGFVLFGVGLVRARCLVNELRKTSDSVRQHYAELAPNDQ